MPSSRNKTIKLTDLDRANLRPKLLSPNNLTNDNCLNSTVLGDTFDVLPRLPNRIADLAIIDPPYNLTKTFGSERFSRMSTAEYAQYLRRIFIDLMPLLKPTASLYLCSEWSAGSAVQDVLSGNLKIRNRVTWEREKGRGARLNWKNASEDIWFATVSDDYTFNLDAVKLRRKVIAPYRDSEGLPKDWTPSEQPYRDTHPSNVWSDITVPFWSMPENTDHPTQKPEKLIAKLILASSNPGDVVLSPFLGSGTDSVVAKKLGRQYIGIELNEEYALLVEKRLSAAYPGAPIQGYEHGVFWERNTQKRPDLSTEALCS